MEELFVRYLHFIGIIILASSLAIQNILISPAMDQPSFRKIVTVDAIYAIGAIITLIAGLLLWLSVGKPKEFYSTNILFQIKLGIFFFVALLSAIPTIFFQRNKNFKNSTLELPHYLILIKRTEAAFIFLLPLLAVLMARGTGLDN